MSKYDNKKRFDFGFNQINMCPEVPEFIHESAIVHPWVKYGKNMRVHEYVTIGTQGWGIFRNKNGNWLHIPHVGGVLIGDNVEIMAHTNVDRGTVNDTIIGDGCKIDHHCHIAHNCKLGKNVVITAGVTFSGSVTVGDNVWIGPGTTIKNKLRIASNTYIGIGSNIVKDIEEEGMLVYGNPARAYKRDELPHNKIG